MPVYRKLWLLLGLLFGERRWCVRGCAGIGQECIKFRMQNGECRVKAGMVKAEGEEKVGGWELTAKNAEGIEAEIWGQKNVFDGRARNLYRRKRR